MLDNETVDGISSFLRPAEIIKKKPLKLLSNQGKGFQGSIPLGMGFILEDNAAQELLQKRPENRDVIFRFLNGEDLNSNPEQNPSRWVINFHDWSIDKAKTYPECFSIVEEKVKPERLKNKDKQRRTYWWRFTRPTLELYKAIESSDKVLVCSEVTKYLAFAFVENDWVYSSNVDVFVPPSYSNFSILQSSFHDAWARTYCSHLETRLKYSTGNGFETYPFPEQHDYLENIGTTYHDRRRQIMLSRQEGLTTTYNRFHNPKESAEDIVRLRELHVEMDNVVAAAYGWNDLDLGHGFHETAQGIRYTISESARREVLSRLLKLNHERYEEEVRAGLHEKGAKKKEGAKKKKSEGGVAAPRLFD